MGGHMTHSYTTFRFTFVHTHPLYNIYAYSQIPPNLYHLLKSLSLMELQRLLSSTFFLFSLLIVAGVTTVCANKQNHNQMYGFRPTKLFVFGDSYSDTGNNQKSLASSWKPPYGRTFPGVPAGRYSDGRVLTDYLARFLGLKSPIPYQWRKYGGNKLRYGMNFAYGGTGVFDTLNFEPNMTTQIDYFEALIKNSVYKKGDLKSSLALVTVSGNDYGAYTLTGGTDQGLPAFITRVVNQLSMNVKRIHDLGVKRVALTALQPLGCLPRITILSSYQQCNDTQNIAVAFHNQLLQQAVAVLNNATKDSSFLVLDLYTSFTTVLSNKVDITGKSKFDSPLKPCCTGITNDTFCGSVDDKGKKMYTVCNEPESMFFWDTVHPTQAGWRAVSLALRPTLNQIYN